MSIPMDATEVAYFSAYRATPRIVKVTKHTKSQVEVDGFSRRFNRATGKLIGGYGGQYIAEVTPKILDRIAAAALHDGASQVWQALCREQVQRAIERMQAFAKEEFGIEISVPEKGPKP